MDPNIGHRIISGGIRGFMDSKLHVLLQAKHHVDLCRTIELFYPSKKREYAMERLCRQYTDII